MFCHSDTIVAPATSPGGALSIIRISGRDSLSICDKCFRSPSGKKLCCQIGYTIHFGNIISNDNSFIDEVLVSVFRSPASYTGEDMVEISCHGSRWIVSEIIRVLIDSGARLAEAGEFTVRAFLAGKLDLAQAEAVADIISSDNKAAHSLAANQLRGQYSEDLSSLRQELLRLSSLLELELDFSEEDVVFADRSELSSVIERTIIAIESLSSTFTLGNAVKEGVAVAIIGSPNVGKSTLLNALLGDDRAIVSDIAGTTRDIIEEHFNIDGIGFRFIDTAGIRQSGDVLERMGIERTYKAASEAQIILYMIDAASKLSDVKSDISNLFAVADDKHNARKFVVVINKCDSIELDKETLERFESLHFHVFTISAKYGRNIDKLKSHLVSTVDSSSIFGGKTIITNARHYHSLRLASESLTAAKLGLEKNVSTDLLTQDIRETLHHIGNITGEITTDEILSEIFSKFCIGK